jgi:hypothetical protein
MGDLIMDIGLTTILEFEFEPISTFNASLLGTLQEKQILAGAKAFANEAKTLAN